MRPKVAFSILLAATLVLALMFFLKRHSPASVSDVAVVPVMANAAPGPAIAPVPVPLVVKKATPEERTAAIAEETERLAVLAMNDDAQSLSNILGDLTSPEKEIRSAAIEAVKQFGSTNAIPVLKAMAANSDDHEEVLALLEAADFLSLPDFDLRGSGDVQLADMAPAAVEEHTGDESNQVPASNQP